jgi:hypothetical protein
MSGRLVRHATEKKISALSSDTNQNFYKMSLFGDKRGYELRQDFLMNLKLLISVVPQEGFEPPTPSLRMSASAT